jgi:NADH dehydrogenase FAD-containing subunit
MGNHLILVGGGTAHLKTIRSARAILRRGHTVTLVTPSDYYYYSAMGPGMLKGTYAPGEARIPIRQLAEERGVRFVAGRVVRIAPASRTLYLDAGSSLTYDVASFDVGTVVPNGLPVAAAEPVLSVKPVENLLDVRTIVRDLLKEKAVPRLLVVGGGAAGVEVSGNLAQWVRACGGRASVRLLAGEKILPGYPRKARLYALGALAASGVEVLEQAHAERLEKKHAVHGDGRTSPYDLCLIATGVQPPPLFRDSGLPTGPHGELLVNEFLQCPSQPRIFGGGDCIHFHRQALDKVGVIAVRQNPVLCHNLLSALEDRPLAPFRSCGPYVLILNLGDGTGILRRDNFAWCGRLTYRLKDFLDRRFVRRTLR